MQFTYGKLIHDGNNIYKFKYIKQKLLYNNTIFDLHDIYGVDSNAANLTSDDT